MDKYFYERFFQPFIKEMAVLHYFHCKNLEFTEKQQKIYDTLIFALPQLFDEMKIRNKQVVVTEIKPVIQAPLNLVNKNVDIPVPTKETVDLLMVLDESSTSKFQLVQHSKWIS